MSIQKIGIVGSGVMGRGIAQLFILNGKNVYLNDVSYKLVENATEYIEDILKKLQTKGKISENKKFEAVNLLYKAKSIEELSGCDLVIEAVSEDINLKKDIFKRLETIVRKDCILTTNTSSLSITEIASVCKNPERVAGLHFFNPVPLMKIVEIVKGIRTNEEICNKLVDLINETGHKAVIAKDTPGFIVNHAGRAYVTEALAILEESIAQPSEIDIILKESVGFKMGPFELLDLTGVDVTHPVTESIYNQFYQDPKYRPSYLLRLRMLAGLLGRKTNQGFYSYNNQTDKILDDSTKNTVYSKYLDKNLSVWVSKNDIDKYNIVINFLEQNKINIQDSLKPFDKTLCIITPIGDDATTSILKENLDPTRTVAIDTLLGIDNHRTLMGSPILNKEYKELALSIFQSDGKTATFIKDSPGFIIQRVLAMIVNIGCTIAQKEITKPTDIDVAVKAGLGYPMGPLELGDYIGPKNVLSILEKMFDIYKDPRYRSSSWLMRRAKLGVSLLTE
jgi:3-hydroxybutyryl-CoA dehydrogenase